MHDWEISSTAKKRQQQKQVIEPNAERKDYLLTFGNSKDTNWIDLTRCSGLSSWCDDKKSPQTTVV